MVVGNPSFADGKSGGLVPGAGWGLLGASFSQLNREDRKLECNSPGRGAGEKVRELACLGARMQFREPNRHEFERC